MYYSIYFKSESKNYKLIGNYLLYESKSAGKGSAVRQKRAKFQIKKEKLFKGDYISSLNELILFDEEMF